MYRFALRPRWILSHLFVLTLVVTMASLGVWQLQRLDQRQERNALTQARMDMAPVPVDQVLTPDSTRAEVAAVEYRRVELVGEWEGDEQVIVRGRSLESSPGSWILTPLRLADGTVAVVNRGWMANDGSFEAVPPRFAVPQGTVRVQGLVQRSQQRGRYGPVDPKEGELTNLARADVTRMAGQLEGSVLPAWIQLTDQDPAPRADAAPRVLDLPEQDEGSHFSYAMQWFIFTTIALVGYPLILRRNAREKALEVHRTTANP